MGSMFGLKRWGSWSKNGSGLINGRAWKAQGEGEEEKGRGSVVAKDGRPQTQRSSLLQRSTTTDSDVWQFTSSVSRRMYHDMIHDMILRDLLGSHMAFCNFPWGYTANSLLMQVSSSSRSSQLAVRNSPFPVALKRSNLLSSASHRLTLAGRARELRKTNHKLRPTTNSSDHY